MNKQKWLSVGTMTAWLILAYILDAITGRVQLYISRTFQIALPYSLLAFLELLFAGTAIFLFWLHLIRTEKSSLVGWLSIVLGLIALVASLPIWTFILTSAVQAPHLQASLFNLEQDVPFIRVIYNLVIRLHVLAGTADLGFLAKAGALTLALGAANLLRKPKEMSLST